MTKVWRKGLPFSAEVAPFLRHMSLVDEHREALLRLQGVWDSLALLGQMSGAATDIAETRAAFQTLTGTLLDSLARRLLANTRQRMRGKAQVAIDILVRNLFERTADVGFLASDGPLRAHVALAADAPEQAGSRAALEARFRAYVAKYSVYDDIVVLSPQGQVLARLDRSVTASHCPDPLIAQALKPGQAYVEHHGATELLGGRQGLIYATAIHTEQGPAGVLCLSFRLADEMASVFGQLLDAGDRSVICLLDAEGQVLLSSDPWQLPGGARLSAESADQRLVFAGRDYLTVGTTASGYEGYLGPAGWTARVLLPVEQAFEVDGEEQAVGAGFEHLSASLDTRDLFDAELRGIPVEAGRIQRNLSRSLWNGKLRSRAQAEASASSASFAVTLLNEVQRTGDQLRLVFEQAIGNLHHSALAAVFDGAVFQARLAIDIMDRNLYERANDCRWWALDVRLQQALAARGTPDEAAAVSQAQAVLQHINSLYTVYSLLLIFDLDGCIVAVSDPAQSQRIGQRLSQGWVSSTLSLRDRERYVVSPHEACGLYGSDGQAATYVYATALQHDNRVVGGIAIVFDGAPQFAAMLGDALPKDQGAAVGLLVTREGRVVSSSDARWAVGARSPVPAELLNQTAGSSRSSQLEIDGVVYAVGLALSGGYREYRRGVAASAEDVSAVVMLPLGTPLEATGAAAAVPFAPPATVPGEKTMDVASFLVEGQWLGLPARQLLEALDQPRITSLPNAPRALVGMLNHGERMLPVLDLGLLMFGRACVAEEAPVIVCRDERGQSLALRVQELGPVFGIHAQHAQLSPTRGGRERLVRGGAETPGAMLTLLALEDLWSQVSGTAPASLGTPAAFELLD